MSGTATILGLAYESPVTEFPVRTGPGTTFAKAAFTISRGLSNLAVLDVQPDSQKTTSDYGRVYQWFNLQFPDGNTGWMRGHVVGLQGDFTQWGYGVVGKCVHAYTLVRDMTAVPAAATAGGVVTPPKPEKASGEQSTLAAAAKETATAKPEKAEESSDGGMSTLASAAKTSTAQPAKPGTPGDPAKGVKPSKPTAPAMVRCKMRAAANTRVGPSTVGFDRGFALPRDAEARLIEVVVENRAQKYRWFKIDYQGQVGWVREDLLTYSGDTEALGLPWDLYPAPLGEERNWVRGFNMPPNFDDSTWKHWGWDWGAPVGSALAAGPMGGTVVESFEAIKANPGSVSTLSKGMSLGDESVYSDPGWGFGYGHFMVVRYSNEQLPDSTKEELAKRGFPGGVCFVMYAHLHERKAEAGTELAPGQVFATCGNSGNSEASHLHLELRASKTANYQRWSAYQKGLMDPVVLFQR